MAFKARFGYMYTCRKLVPYARTIVSVSYIFFSVNSSFAQTSTIFLSTPGEILHQGKFSLSTRYTAAPSHRRATTHQGCGDIVCKSAIDQNHPHPTQVESAGVSTATTFYDSSRKTSIGSGSSHQRSATTYKPRVRRGWYFHSIRTSTKPARRFSLDEPNRAELSPRTPRPAGVHTAVSQCKAQLVPDPTQKKNDTPIGRQVVLASSRGNRHLLAFLVFF
ncbi:hypothetical protein RRG08_019278 [Elysia crispata]|uniref:Uncharacterized protein n=1 Tax=Elysia crispata TaxID=231223 RepID=A0AAE0XMX9_9GAST|nr:hypothetical protein RRG08_019278 [Elysia crispata]